MFRVNEEYCIIGFGSGTLYNVDEIDKKIIKRLKTRTDRQYSSDVAKTKQHNSKMSPAPYYTILKT